MFKFRASKYLKGRLVGLAGAVAVFALTPKASASATVGDGNASYGFSFVSATGINGMPISQSDLTSFYDVVSNYSITGTSSNTLSVKLQGKNLFFDSNSDIYENVASIKPVRNSSYDWYDMGDGEMFEDKTGIGSGNAWIYAIENKGEKKFITGSESGTYNVTFSNTLSSTMYIYVPIEYEYTESAEYTNSSYDYGVAKYAFNLNVDNEAPTLSCNVPNGGFTNTAVTMTAEDPNFYRLYYKKDNGSYSYTTAKSYTTNGSSGTYYFYAEDTLGNRSSVYSFTCDKTVPVGVVTSGGVNIANGSYTSKSFTYSATDNASGVRACYYKTPKMSSYTTYTGATIGADSGDGWYYFYSVDNQGNQSVISTVYLETATPTVKIYRNGSLIYTGSHTAGSKNTNLYFNVGDTYRFDYTSPSGVCTSSITENSTYSITSSGTKSFTVTSATGVSATYSFKAISIKPTLTINGNTYRSGSTIVLRGNEVGTFNVDSSITDHGVTGTTIRGYGNNAITKTLYHSNTKTFDFITATGTETQYEVTINDRAGNTSTFTVIIDKEPYYGEFFTVDDERIYSDSHIKKGFWLDFDSDEVSSLTYSKDGSEYQNYVNQRLTADGTFTFIITDKAGNKTTQQIVIDTKAPTGQIYAGGVPISSGTAYTNKSVFFTWDEDVTCTVNGRAYTKNQAITAQGRYTFRLTDKAGNYSEYTIQIDTSAPTLNKNRAESQASTPVSKWYKVTYDNVTKSFKDYNDALAYAKELERNKYVKTLNLSDVSEFNQYHLVATKGNAQDEVKVGTYFKYKAMSNSSTELFYFDEALLDEAITYYAKSYVSNVNYYVPGGTNNYGTLDSSMYDDTWTTPDGTKVPLGNNFVFNQGDSTRATAKLVGTNAEYSITYGRVFGGQFPTNGLYEIKEYDQAGNVTTFYLYVDLEAPSLSTRVEVFGENAVKSMTISKDSLSSISAYYYKTFEITDILDSDTWATIAITSGGKTTYYTNGDVLPTLNEGGEYTLKVYDRLNNSYGFTVYIVGNKADLTWKENTDSTELKLDITLEQKFDALVSIEILKDGEALSGVSTDKLSYTFTKDGLYKVILKDNFGRVIEETYDFNKSLPKGSCNVENNTKTTSNVNFTFDSSKYYAVINGTTVNRTGSVSLTENGSYIVKLINLTDEENFSIYSYQIDRIAPTLSVTNVNNGEVTNKNVTVSWSDLDVARATYKINGSEAKTFTSGTTFKSEGLYEITVVDDLGNSATVEFEIDKTIDYVLLINNVSSPAVDTTSQNISLTSNEPLNVTVTKDGEVLDYDFGGVLYEEGYYTFYVEDMNGNSITFAIMIDKSVDLDLNVMSGAITNNDVVINALEQVTINVTKDGNSYPYSLGDRISGEGKYKVVAQDQYGNIRTITFEIVKGIKRELNYAIDSDIEITSVTRNGRAYTWNSNILNFTEDGTYHIVCERNGETHEFELSLDTTAPNIILGNVSNGGTTNKKVLVSWTDTDVKSATYKFNGGESRNFVSGTEFTNEGTYEITLTDNLGNVRVNTFTIDKTVSYELLVNGTVNQNCTSTGSDIKIKPLETLTAQVTKNGATYPYTLGDTISTHGNYHFVLTDNYGNVKEFDVFVDKEVDVTTNVLSGAISSKDVVITADEAVTITVTKNGQAYSYTLGSTITTEGKYVAVIKDKYNNTKTIKFEIVKGVKKALNYSISDDIVIKSITRNGKAFSWNSNILKFTQDGTYVITCDNNGTDYSFELSLDTTAPTINLSNVNDRGTTNKDVTVSWTDKDVAKAVYKINGSGEIAFTSGKVFSAEGVYEIILEDHLQNRSTKTFTIDKTVDYTLHVNNAAVLDVTKTGGNVTITANEPLTIKVLRDGESFSYNFGDVINREGDYSFTLTDAYGNVKTLNIYIDKSVDLETNVLSGAISSSDVIIRNNEEATIQVTKDGKAISYRFGQALSDEGNYKVIAQDLYGNTKTITFQIVKGVKRSLNYAIDSDITIKSITRNGSPFSWNSHLLNFTEDGTYVIICDNNGTDYSFELKLDTTAPNIILSNVTNSGTTKENVTVSWTDNDVVKATCKFNGGTASNIVSGTTFSNEGTYVITLIDHVGNVSTSTFTIDKTVEYQLLVNDRLDQSCTKTGYDIKIVGLENLNVKVTRNNEAYNYTLGDYITAHGNYHFELTDNFGNVKEFDVFVDKEVDVTTNVLSGAISSKDVVINANEQATITLTKDGKTFDYRFGGSITAEGKYKAVIQDNFGNSKTITFQIVKGVKRSLNYAIDFDINILSITRNGEPFTWNSNVLNFTEDGTYVITCDNNGSDYTFELSLDTTGPVIVMDNVSNGGTTNKDVTVM